MVKKYHLWEHDIPDGHTVLTERLSVAGIHHRKAAAMAFCRGRSQSLELHSEPNNRHDQNAIKIVGEWTGWFLRHSTHIGYVPAELASMLNELDIVQHVHARLLKTYIGRQGYVEILFQLTCDKETTRSFKSHYGLRR